MCYTDAELAQIVNHRSDKFNQKSFSAGPTGAAAARAVDVAGATAFQQQTPHNYSYGVSNNHIVDHAARGVQFPTGHEGTTNFESPGQGEPMGYRAGGPHHTPTHVRPRIPNYGMPLAPGSAGRGNSFGGNNIQGQAYGYGRNLNAPLYQDLDYGMENYE
jgi:hypothetical protein